jgi:hypothetical protein
MADMLAWFGGEAGLDHDRADEGGVEREDNAQIWLLWRCLGDPARDGQLSRRNEVMRGIVAVEAVAQHELLAALGDHAQGWVGHAMAQVTGYAGAAHAEARQRLGDPVFGNGSRETLDQFGTASLRLEHLRCWLLSSYHPHRHRSPCSCI